ncbi:outer membrane protein assembly factor BamD [Aeoliella sp. ICT_H6.2]|uniref:Outer membrane protein assembly factor BamD n=1 Tax=Aeoliella straminimaris TaxID=2954799 RepID=A0A9X2F607_9BACT|nr:outer membrane protein assembly factor BamD [Aeoliella straminimaris]MCO6042348.1 outer membrane protein assembly factor BamD [Aeoliella straminimaris]
MPSMPTFGAAAKPGTKEWWKKNKNKAEYVVGKGFQVEGAPGYYDSHGQPMDAPMAEEALVFSREENSHEGLLPGLDPKKQYSKAKEAVGLGPNQQKATDAYQAGQELYAQEKYRRAAKRFSEAASRWPNSTLEQQAMYQEANCYFYDDKYIDARDKYVELLDKYPNSAQVDSVIERMWAIAQYWEQHQKHEPHWAVTPNLIDETRPWFDTMGHAVKTYEDIQLYDPTGPRADDSIMAIAGIHFRTGRFGDADHYYELLRQQYPRSDFQFEAHLLGLQTKLRKYQGPEYDGAPLEEAKKLAKQLGNQFSRQLNAEERERLRETQGEVARAIVERDMSMARHYENTGQYGSAKVYYAEVLRKHPQSQLAADARTRLAQIADEPAVPEEPVKWLIDMFPENPERTRVARVPELRDSRGDNEAPEQKDDDSTLLR